MTIRQRIWVTWAIGLAAVYALLASAAMAAPPRVDRGFGLDGVASTTFAPQADIEPFREIASTSEGGVITRSSYYGGTEIRHYGPDGTLADVESNVEDGEEIEIERAEATTPEGGRLVAGNSHYEARGAVSRYRPDGALDTSFGSAGTSEKLPLEVQAVAPLPSGKVLVAGKGLLASGGTKSQPTFQVFVARLGSDGKIETSFGKGGIVKLDSEDKVGGEEALDVQGRQGDGAEVVDGSTVVALDPSGNLDPGFGEGGRVTTPGPAVGAAAAAGEAVVVAGTRSLKPPKKEEWESAEEFYVARYTAGGKLDPTFAGGAAVGVLDPEGEVKANAALFGSDGSVTIAGLVTDGSTNCPPGYSCNRTPVVVRFAPDGRPDSGFGEGGIVRISSLAVPFQTDYYYGVEALAARPGGGLFAAGEGNDVTFVAALAANGSLDGSFGTGGLVTKGGSEPSSATPIATGVDRAGRVYALVQSDSGTGLSEGTVVLRYLPDGAIDQSFGEGGRAYVPPWSRALAVAPDGSSYVTSGQTSTLTKLSPSGSLDPGFGDGGSVVLPTGEAFEPSAVVRLSDGDVLVGGGLTGRAGPWPAAIRYLPDGKLDRSFGRGGIGLVRPGRSGSWDLETMAVDHQGRILLAGSQRHDCCDEKGAVVRIDGDGRLDRSFGRGGYALVGGRGTTGIGGLALRGGRILAAATASGANRTRDLLYSLGPEGGLDHRFGNNGVAIARPRNGGRDPYESVAVFSIRSRILLARSYPGDPLVAFSVRGKLERGFARRLSGLIPRRRHYSVGGGPAATFDRGNLLLAWTTHRPGHTEHGKQCEVSLHRVLLG
jgi:uncharacterized delta-60 repeat protein